MKRLVAKLSVAALILIGAVALVVSSVWSTWSTYGNVSRDPDDLSRVEVVIERGSSPRAIVSQLAGAGVIDDEEGLHRYLLSVDGAPASLKAGHYLLSPSMTADELIAELQTGRADQVRVTIQEGLRQENIARLIARTGICSEADLLAAMRDPSLIEELATTPSPGGLEGYLFPDTYHFAKKVAPADILRRLRARLDDVVTDRMHVRMADLGWDLHQVLTLASIIEKETGKAEERAHISSVFHNRLAQGMKLQTDPTVIYGIAEFDGDLSRNDLLTHHAYNTYTIKGLPPGPIASAGLSAIKAVLWPANTKDLFFVSKNDGTHSFCPDYDCHKAEVQKWQVDYFAQE